MLQLQPLQPAGETRPAPGALMGPGSPPDRGTMGSTSILTHDCPGYGDKPCPKKRVCYRTKRCASCTYEHDLLRMQKYYAEYCSTATPSAELQRKQATEVEPSAGSAIYWTKVINDHINKAL